MKPDKLSIHDLFQKERRYWHIPERQGRLTRPRIDLFIFHFLVMQTGRELSIGHIFQEFRDWRDQSGQSLEGFLGELKRYAVIFRGLISPTGTDQVALFAGRLRSLDTSTVYPLLLYVLGLSAEKLSHADRNQIIADVESWMIRRFVCQLTNKNYNKFFVSLLAKVREVAGAEAPGADEKPTSERLTSIVREELTRSDDVTVRWPNDTEFEKGWLEKPTYVKSRPDRAVMLLTAIDNAMRTNKNEYKHAPEDVSVEHLLPQQGSISDYPYPAEPTEPDGFMRRLGETHHGRRRINSVFGEGSSPRMRQIREGLNILGINDDSLLKQHLGRKVYGCELYEGAREDLLGFEKRKSRQLVPSATAIARGWIARWLSMRIQNDSVLDRLRILDRDCMAKKLADRAKDTRCIEANNQPSEKVARTRPSTSSTASISKSSASASVSRDLS